MALATQPAACRCPRPVPVVVGAFLCQCGGEFDGERIGTRGVATPAGAPVYLRRGATPGEDVGSLDPSAGEMVGRLEPIAPMSPTGGRFVAVLADAGPLLAHLGLAGYGTPVPAPAERPPFAASPEPQPDANHKQGLR